MPITGIRQGAAVKVAAKFQTAQGSPVTVWANSDVLRADEAPAPTPNVEVISQTGTSGSPYEQIEGVRLVGIEPTVEATIKVSRPSILLFLESLLGVTPTAIPGPPPAKVVEGFAFGIPKYLTYIWDDAYEAIRAYDVWVHILELSSRAAENLVMSITGSGYQIDRLAAQLGAVNLTNFDTYSHKESTLEDVTGAAVSLMAIEQSVRLESGRFVSRANAVAPNFVGKDGRITVAGSIRTRLYDDTATYFQKTLDLARIKLKMTYVQQEGKKIIIEFFNVIVNAPYPRRTADGTLDDYVIDWTARRSGPEGGLVNPIKITVED